MKLACLFCLSLLLIPSFGFSNEDDHHEEVEATNTGPEKGVTEATRESGFKLTQEAVQHLGINVSPVKKQGTGYRVPESALASSMREHFIYALIGGFFKPIEVEIVEKSGLEVIVKPEHAEEPLEQIAISGVRFLRNIEVDIFSGEEGGHH